MSLKDSQEAYKKKLIEQNPCYEEQQLSLQCLQKNDFDHEICEAFFDNFKACKKFWNNVMSHRRSKGISPILPTPEERLQIKAERKKTLNI